jgi:DNA ligase-1
MATLHFLNEGDKVEIQGSGKSPYIVKCTGGVIDCSCPAWRNLGGPIDTRVCKHMKANIDPACMAPGQQKAMGLAPTKAAKSKKAHATKTESKVGEPPLLLAHSWEDEDPTGWWISEKLDGVRAYWDGEKFISRLGNIYHAPEWFKLAMPQGVKLDGELFAGRKKFDETVGAVKKLHADDKEWKRITYQVFDILDFPEPFEKRLEYLAKLDMLGNDGYWSILEQIKCKSLEDMLERLSAVEAMGGEGLMLRQPNSMYEAGRSRTLLKVKTFKDAEATVTAHEPGKGKHEGRMGALLCEMPDGTIFKVGTGFTDKQRENPPSIGSKITYKYQELTKAGVPRFPAFVAARDYE